MGFRNIEGESMFSFLQKDRWFPYCKKDREKQSELINEKLSQYKYVLKMEIPHPIAYGAYYGFHWEGYDSFDEAMDNSYNVVEYYEFSEDKTEGFNVLYDLWEKRRDY